MSRASRVPSKQLARSTALGASIGSAIEIAAYAWGIALPPGSGASLAATATALVHYLQGHGRKPAAPETER